MLEQKQREFHGRNNILLQSFFMPIARIIGFSRETCTRNHEIEFYLFIYLLVFRRYPVSILMNVEVVDI